MLTTNTTAVLAPTYASPSRVEYSGRNAQDSPRYYENVPSGGKLLYTNPTFPEESPTLNSQSLNTQQEATFLLILTVLLRLQLSRLIEFTENQ